jgi:hypothetical protein
VSLSERGAGYETTVGVQGERRAASANSTGCGLTVRSAAAGRAILDVHRERLADKAEREQQRHHWQGVVNAVAKALTESG